MNDKTKQVKFGIKWKRKIRFSKKEKKKKKKGKSQSSKSSTLLQIGTYSQLLFTVNFSVKSNISAVTCYHLHFHQLSFYQRLGFYWITLTLLQPAVRNGNAVPGRVVVCHLPQPRCCCSAAVRCPPPGARVRRGQHGQLRSLLFSSRRRRKTFSLLAALESPPVPPSPPPSSLPSSLSLSLSLSQQLPFTRTIRNYNGSVNYAIALVFDWFFKLRESTPRSFFCRHWWLHSKYALRIYVPEVLRFSSRPLLKLTWSFGEFLLFLLLAKLFVLVILLVFYLFVFFPLGWVEVGRKT